MDKEVQAADKAEWEARWPQQVHVQLMFRWFAWVVLGCVKHVLNLGKVVDLEFC